MFTLNAKDDKVVPKVNYLQIVKDEVVLSSKIENLFDNKKYTNLNAITYVSSPAFFSKYTSGFDNVNFILGIPDASYLNNFINGLSNFFGIKKRIEFFNNLSDSIKDGVTNKKINIRFGKPDISIHSKIYLLENIESNTNRLILGSANFTDKAFKGRKQYEDIIVFDNSILYDLYKRRFDSIWNETIDYIPEECKKRHQKQKEIVYIGDAEALKDVLIDEISKNKTSLKISEDQMNEIEDIPIEVVNVKEDIDITKKVIELISTRRKGQYKLKSDVALEKVNNSLKTVICKINKNSNHVDNRVFLKAEKNIIYVCDDKLNNKYITFSVKAINKDIKRNLMAINDFIKAYELFTVNPNVQTQSKIFEIILYAFISPFIWKIRREIVLREGRDSVRANIHPFLIIAGRAFSGKTTALEFIGLLLGNNAPYYIPYNYVKGKNALYDFFYTENISPFLIDEISSSFFTSTASDKGESFFKDIGNSLSSKHPCMIGTTNASNFNIPYQVRRRLYYIQIDNTFDKKKRSIADKYFNNVVSKIDTTLFKDFTEQVCELIREGRHLNTDGDYLRVAREIFKNYYDDCQLVVPKWFPETRFFDYEDRAKNLWKNLYQSYRECFKKRDDNTIIVDTSCFANNNRDRKSIINYLAPECVKEDNQILCLYSEQFFNFIDEENPFVRSSIIRIFKNFIK